MNKPNYIRLIRHATLIIQLGNTKILVDPMFSNKDEMEPVQNCGNDNRIPMTGLPFDQQELINLLKDIDALVITHLHRDHWDGAAQSLVGKDTLIFCQPSDVRTIRDQGFYNVKPIPDEINWEGIQISRTKGKHGTGEMGKKMGEVSGFVFEHRDNCVYVAGDTIWCDDILSVLQKFNPDTTIVNAGGAQFLTGDPITMTVEDVLMVQNFLPQTRIIAVHMDTINHCLVSRSDLKNGIQKISKPSPILIPLDGERIDLD